MPQMAPMWWTSLFMMTILSMLLMMIINYFNTLKNVKNNKSIKNDYKTLYWMW